MLKIVIVLSIFVLLVPLISSSFADTVDITILRGSADSHVSRTFSPPVTNALVGDIVRFGNGDTVVHSVTSGTPDNPDGRFDSGTIGLGKFFSYTLTTADTGEIHFYDKTYPWMTGVLNVKGASTNFKVMNNVGANVGDGKTTFNVQYSSPKDIISSVINPKDKSITFILVGKTETNSTLVLRLPTGLIAPPFLGIQLDGQFTNNFTTSQEQGTNVITIPITPLTEQVSVVGTTVVPEFGPIAELVLVASIIATIMFARIRLGHKLA